jgi:hypothetical protein
MATHAITMPSAGLKTKTGTANPTQVIAEVSRPPATAIRMRIAGRAIASFIPDSTDRI